MKVDCVYISTYRYDFHLARICIASIRYWYPDVPIFLIKDESGGSFDTADAETRWNVRVFDTKAKKFGWGYGKLEPLFLEERKSFFVIDADAVIAGPVLDLAANTDADFIVDDEVQDEKRFNEIYYRLDLIHRLDPHLRYPGYSFNTGQWFGTSSLLSRHDFSRTLVWGEPPVTKDNNIIFNNDQSHLNYVLHAKNGLLNIARKKMMIWPVNGNADFIDINKIRSHVAAYPLVIHWAGMSAVKFRDLPRLDILMFYRDFYYSRLGKFAKLSHGIRELYLKKEKSVKFRLKQMA